MPLLFIDTAPATTPESWRERSAGRARPHATAALLWLVFRLYQLALGCHGEGTDVELYKRYAADLRSGAAASPDFRPEYPPGALTLFLAPAVVKADRGYRHAFVALMAALDLATCLLVFERARRRPRAAPSAPLLHATLYLLLTAALWPVLYARFDLAPAAFVLAALHCLDRGRERWSWTLLGVAGALKLWPFALAPLWIVWRRPTRDRARRAPRAVLGDIAIGAVCLAGGAAIASLPVLFRLGSRVGSSLRFLADRGLQIESTWASLVLVLARLGLTEAKAAEAFGAVQLSGPLPIFFCALSLPVTAVLVTLPLVVVVATDRRRVVLAPAGGLEGVAAQSPEDDAGSRLELAVLAVILGAMIPAKVLSPQFVLWIVPLLALVARRPVDWILAFMTAALTTEIYPYGYPALLDQSSGHGHAVVALAARNALLIGWYVTAIRRYAKQRAPLQRLGESNGTLRGPILPLRPAGEQHRPGR